MRTRMTFLLAFAFALVVLVAAVVHVSRSPLTTAVHAQSSTFTDTRFFPLVFGPPAIEEQTVAPYDGARLYSGGETWQEARDGGDLHRLGPNGTRLEAIEYTPGGTLAIYAFSRSIAYFDTGDLADRRVAGDLTLTYYHDGTRQPLDLPFALVFRRASTAPAEPGTWGQFDDWSVLASQPVTSTAGVTRSVTLASAPLLEADGTLPKQVAIGIQTGEPHLVPGQSLSASFWLDRMTLTVPLQQVTR